MVHKSIATLIAVICVASCAGQEAKLNWRQISELTRTPPIVAVESAAYPVTAGVHAATAVGSYLQLRKSRGTFASPTVINDSDYVAGIVALAHDGSDYHAIADILIKAGTKQGGGAPYKIPSQIEFWVWDGVTANPTQQMTLTSAGRLGIGSASPVTQLHVLGANTAPQLTVDGGTRAVDLFGGATGNALDFSSEGDFFIRTKTYANRGTASASTLVTVKSSGNVGIGTTAPTTFKLQVAGAVGPNTDDAGALGSATLSWSDLFLASGALINFANGDATLTHAADTLSFAGANVGVSTTSPAGVLHAAASAAGYGVVSSLHAASATGAYALLRKSRGTNAVPTVIDDSDYIGGLVFDAYDGSAYHAVADILVKAGAKQGGGAPYKIPTEIQFWTWDGVAANPAQRAVLDSGGDFGIGTTTPLSTLHVADSASAGATIELTGADADLKKWFIEAATDYTAGQADLFIRVANDAFNSFTDIFTLTRDGVMYVPFAAIGDPDTQSFAMRVVGNSNVEGQLLVEHDAAPQVQMNYDGTHFGQIEITSTGSFQMFTRGDTAGFVWERYNSGTEQIMGLSHGASLIIGLGSTERGELLLMNADTAHFVGFQPGATSSSYMMTLPLALPAANRFMRIDSSGVLTFSQVDLASVEVTGILPAANGGVGGLTATRVPFSDGSILVTDADLTFATDTLSATKLLSTLITTRVASGIPILVFDHTGESSLKSYIEFQDDGVFKAAFGVDFAADGGDALFIRSTTSPAELNFYTSTSTFRGRIGTGTGGVWIYNAQEVGILIEDTTGDVGIGTLTPAARIDSLSTTEQLRLSYDISNYASFTVGSAGALTVTPKAGSNLNVSLSTTGDFAVNTNQLYVDTSAARVGIGTASPSQALHVTGYITISDSSKGMLIGTTSAAAGNYLLDARRSGFAQLYLEGNSTTAGAADFLLKDTAAATDAKFFGLRNQSGVGSISSFTDGGGFQKQGIIAWSNLTGNVGINTTSPAGKLHVVDGAAIGYGDAMAIFTRTASSTDTEDEWGIQAQILVPNYAVTTFRARAAGLFQCETRNADASPGLDCVGAWGWAMINGTAVGKAVGVEADVFMTDTGDDGLMQGVGSGLRNLSLTHETNVDSSLAKVNFWGGAVTSETVCSSGCTYTDAGEASKTVANVSNGAAGKVRIQTSTAHGRSSGHLVNLSAVTGCTTSNGVPINNTHKITVIDADEFDLNGTTTCNSAWAGGGTVKLAVQPITAWASMLNDRYQAEVGLNLRHAITDFIRIGNPDQSGAVGIRFLSPSEDATDGNWIANILLSENGSIYGYDSNSFAKALFVFGSDNTLNIGTLTDVDSNGDILFTVDAVEAARINSSRFLGVGTASPQAKVYIAGNVSKSSWTTTGPAFGIEAATFTDTSGSGTIANRIASTFGPPTFASSSAVTVTKAANVIITPPVAGTNTTITTGLALQLTGTMELPGGSTSNVGLHFTDDPNTGLYQSAADNLDFVTAGSVRVNISSIGDITYSTYNNFQNNVDISGANKTLYLGGAGDGSNLLFKETTTAPDPPSNGVQARVYMKGDKLIIQYLHGATEKWWYLDLTSTSGTWTYTAVEP